MANLPATRIEVYVPNAWDDVGKGCGLFDDCWPPNKFLLKGAGALEPDIRAANDWASYREGRDLIVDAIPFRHRESRHGPPVKLSPGTTVWVRPGSATCTPQSAMS